MLGSEAPGAAADPEVPVGPELPVTNVVPEGPGLPVAPVPPVDPEVPGTPDPLSAVASASGTAGSVCASILSGPGC